MSITTFIKKALSRQEAPAFSKVALEPRDDYGVMNRMTVNPLLLRGLDHS